MMAFVGGNMTRIDMLAWDNWVLCSLYEDLTLVQFYLHEIKSKYSSIDYAGNNYNINSIEYNSMFGIVFNVGGYYKRIAHTSITNIYEK